jgi:SagB-type dehydrogenase family enzyme
MRNFILFCAVFTAILSLSVPATAAEGAVIKLPTPEKTGGKPLMEALAARQSDREFSDREIPLQTLSNLLWAAFGINRPESGKRTAPSAKNWQEIDIYITLPDGAYRYDAKENCLQPVVEKDLRALTGKQPFVKDAYLNLVYVSDLSRIEGVSADAKAVYSAADTGFIAQNAYLFCASEGLNTVVRGWVDKDALAKALGLGAQQKVILCQTVGYPKK